MKREEAIKVLKKELQIIDDPNVTMTAREWEEHDDHMRDALEMVIEALEHDKKEIINMKSVFNLSEDVISRRETLKGYQSVCKDIACHECRAKDADGTCRLESFINNLSTAQPFTEEQIQTMQELEFAQVEKAYELGKADRPKGEWIENAQEYYEMINEKGGEEE